MAHSHPSVGRPQLSLVICTYEEAEAIGPVLDEVRDVLDGAAFEIIVVDDSETGRTAQVVTARAAADSRIRLIRRTDARGLASAAIAGWDAARGDLLGIMDGDGQHDPAILRALLRQMDEAEVSVGSRYAPGADTGLAGMRQLISQAGTLLSRVVIGAPVSDPLSGLFVMRRGWFETVRPRLTGLGFKILADVLACGPRAPKVAETATALRSRIGGESKLDMRVMAELLAQLVQARTGGLVRARFVMFAGVGSLGVGVHLAVLSASVAAHAPFWAAQLMAIGVAMTTNFLLNNVLTFRDRRLKGAALWRGLGAFYVACSGGAVVSEAVANLIVFASAPWWGAGLAGAVSSALWNYVWASRMTWAGARPATIGGRAPAAEPAPFSAPALH